MSFLDIFSLSYRPDRHRSVFSIWYKNIDKWHFVDVLTYMYFICYIEEVVFWIIYKGDLHIQMYRSAKSQGYTRMSNCKLFALLKWSAILCTLTHCCAEPCQKLVKMQFSNHRQELVKLYVCSQEWFFLYSVTPTGISDSNRNRLRRWYLGIFLSGFDCGSISRPVDEYSITYIGLDLLWIWL